MSNLHQIFIRYIKYASSTLVGTIVDMLILWFLSTELLHGYIGEYIISPCISFECAVIANYLVAYHFVWKDRVLLHPQKKWLVSLPQIQWILHTWFFYKDVHFVVTKTFISMECAFV